jgi:thiol-disulfide isomerase/thioredoxin
MRGGAGADVPAAGVADDDSNPYLAPEGLGVAELVDFILEMQDKPQSIQKRHGFAAAVSEAADRILAAQASDKQQRIAISAKFAALHRAAVAGDREADKQLALFVERCRDDPRPEVAREVRFFQAESAAIAASQLPPEKIPAALAELRTALELEQRHEPLSARHLRMASAIVEAINRLEDDDFRETRFQEFGRLLATSPDKELARYGRRLAENSADAASQWVGKSLELAGSTILGTSFQWSSYRGKVVVVDFWASWCEACRVEMPLLKELHEKYSARGFDVVGVNLDKDTAALERFLQAHSFPWTILAGQESLACARRLGVSGLPTMLLVDGDGKVVSVAHTVGELSSRVESLLARS